MSQRLQLGVSGMFVTHTAAVYRLMTLRVERKYGPGAVPFSLAEFRQWLIVNKFDGNVEKPIQCTYCEVWMHAGNFITDHRDSLFYGGSPDLDNLDLICDSCNGGKGRMSAVGFRKLVEFSRLHLDARDANDMFSRMKNGEAYRRLKAQGANKKRCVPERISGRMLA
jgi:hypothetical protein